MKVLRTYRASYPINHHMIHHHLFRAIYIVLLPLMKVNTLAPDNLHSISYDLLYSSFALPPCHLIGSQFKKAILMHFK